MSLQSAMSVEAPQKGVMNDQERSVLRWGGFAGVLGGIAFLFVPVVLFGFVPTAPADPMAVINRFPSVSAAITVGNNINFVADILDLSLILAVFVALRRTSLAPALFGTVMSVLGLGVLFTESQTQV